MPVNALHRDAQSAEFFDATADGRLLLRKCGNCGHISEPRTEMCPQCAATTLSWTPSAGKGSITAYGVINRRSGDGPSRVPVAIVELDEGPWLSTQIVGSDPDAAHVGSRVELTFERPDGSEAVPVFRLAQE
jgi:hypothetical protein